MNRTQKADAVADLHGRFARATVVIATGFQGLTVEEISGLRRRVREAKAEIKVVKNSLVRRAVKDTPVTALADALTGPVAVTFGYADPIAPVKALVEFAQREPRLTLLGGVVEAHFITGDGIMRLATLPSRIQLLARVAAGLNAPLSGLVMVLVGPVRGVIQTLAAIRDQRGAASTSST